MKAKRLLAALLTASAIFSLTACGGASGSAGDKASGEASESGDSGEIITLKIAHGASETYHLHRALLLFKEAVEETGRFQVEIYPNQQFGSDEEMIQGVKTGDLTMAVCPTSYLPNDVPSMALIELPYVFPNRATALATLKSDWGQKELELLEDAGLHGLGYLENGMRHITSSKKEIKTPEDLNGMKFRTMQVEAHVSFFNSLGASAEGSPFSELYTNLSTGVFDGEENPIAHIYANKFYEVQKYITLTEHVYTAYIPVMKQSFWESLSEEDQKILEDAYRQAYDCQMSLIEEEESAQLQEMEDYGCVVTYLTEEEKAAFIEAAQQTLEKYRDSLGVDVYDAFTAAVEANTVTE